MAILLIGDRAPAEYEAVRSALAGEHDVVVAGDVGHAFALLRTGGWSLAVLDDDEAALDRVLEVAGATPVVVVLPRPTLSATLDALEAGARDVHAPPLSAERLRDLALPVEVAADPGQAPVSAAASLMGESAAMLDVYRAVARAAASDLPLLLVGEAGTGKELLARVVHERSGRAAGPFVAVNCAAIPPQLLAAELFGSDPSGSGSGGKRGWIARADGGTLFLEDVGALPGALQQRLQRLLETGELEAAGAVAGARAMDVRLIAATDVDLQDAVLRQRFRPELYDRLAEARIDVPPLRERGSDVRLLARHLLSTLRGGSPAAAWTIEDAALDALERYSWPGNIRQLRTVLARAVAVADGPILRISHLPAEVLAPPAEGPAQAGEFLPLAEMERRHIERALALTGGHLGQAARLLGIHRNTLRRKLEAYQLPRR